jgi:chromate transporter
VLLLALGVAAVLVVRAAPAPGNAPRHASAATGLGALVVPTVAASTAALAPTTVFLSFAKIGSVLFGSGYVLLSFLRSEFGERLHALTDAQLLDAIAVGQVTPGPVFSAATFVGYLLAGHAGALAATAGIFLPAFVGVAATAPFVRALRQNPRLAPALDVVNAVSLALMLSVVLVMARGVAASTLGLAIFVATSLLLLTTRVGAGWVLLAGGLAGLLRLL